MIRQHGIAAFASGVDDQLRALVDAIFALEVLDAVVVGEVAVESCGDRFGLVVLMQLQGGLAYPHQAFDIARVIGLRLPVDALRGVWAFQHQRAVRARSQEGRIERSILAQGIQGLYALANVIGIEQVLRLQLLDAAVLGIGLVCVLGQLVLRRCVTCHHRDQFARRFVVSLVQVGKEQAFLHVRRRLRIGFGGHLQWLDHALQGLFVGALGEVGLVEIGVGIARGDIG